MTSLPPHRWCSAWLLGYALLVGSLFRGAAEPAAGDPPKIALDPFAYQEGAVVRGSKSTRQLALVFTGHEFAEGAGPIMEALARHGAKASFFLTGDFLRHAEFAPLIRRMLAEGY